MPRYGAYGSEDPEEKARLRALFAGTPVPAPSRYTIDQSPATMRRGMEAASARALSVDPGVLASQGRGWSAAAAAPPSDLKKNIALEVQKNQQRGQRVRVAANKLLDPNRKLTPEEITQAHADLAQLHQQPTPDMKLGRFGPGGTPTTIAGHPGGPLPPEVQAALPALVARQKAEAAGGAPAVRRNRFAPMARGPIGVGGAQPAAAPVAPPLARVGALGARAAPAAPAAAAPAPAPAAPAAAPGKPAGPAAAAPVGLRERMQNQFAAPFPSGEDAFAPVAPRAAAAPFPSGDGGNIFAPAAPQAAVRPRVAGAFPSGEGGNIFAPAQPMPGFPEDVFAPRAAASPAFPEDVFAPVAGRDLRAIPPVDPNGAPVPAPPPPLIRAITEAPPNRVGAPDQVARAPGRVGVLPPPPFEAPPGRIGAPQPGRPQQAFTGVAPGKPTAKQQTLRDARRRGNATQRAEARAFRQGQIPFQGGVQQGGPIGVGGELPIDPRIRSALDINKPAYDEAKDLALQGERADIEFKKAQTAALPGESNMQMMIARGQAELALMKDFPNMPPKERESLLNKMFQLPGSAGPGPTFGGDRTPLPPTPAGRGGAAPPAAVQGDINEADTYFKNHQALAALFPKPGNPEGKSPEQFLNEAKPILDSTPEFAANHPESGIFRGNLLAKIRAIWGAELPNQLASLAQPTQITRNLWGPFQNVANMLSFRGMGNPVTNYDRRETARQLMTAIGYDVPPAERATIQGLDPVFFQDAALPHGVAPSQAAAPRPAAAAGSRIAALDFMFPWLSQTATPSQVAAPSQGGVRPPAAAPSGGNPLLESLKYAIPQAAAPSGAAVSSQANPLLQSLNPALLPARAAGAGIGVLDNLRRWAMTPYRPGAPARRKPGTGY